MPMYHRRFSGMANRNRYNRAAGYAGAVTRSAPGFNSVNPLLSPGAQGRMMQTGDAMRLEHYQMKLQEQQEADRHLASVLGLQTQQLHNQLALSQHRLGLAREGYDANPMGDMGGGTVGLPQNTMLPGGRLRNMIPQQGGQVGLRPGSVEAFQAKQRGFAAARENRPYRVTDATLGQAMGGMGLPSQVAGPQSAGLQTPYPMDQRRLIQSGMRMLPQRIGVGPEPMTGTMAAPSRVGLNAPGMPAFSGTPADVARQRAAWTADQQRLGLQERGLAQEGALSRERMAQEAGQFNARMGLQRDELGENRRQFDTHVGLQRDELTAKAGMAAAEATAKQVAERQKTGASWVEKGIMTPEAYQRYVQTGDMSGVRVQDEALKAMKPEDIAPFAGAMIGKMYADESLSVPKMTGANATGETALTPKGRALAAAYLSVRSKNPDLSDEQVAARAAAKVGFLNFADPNFERRIQKSLGKDPDERRLAWADEMRSRRTALLDSVRQATAPYQVKVGITTTAEQLVLDAMMRGYSPDEAIAELSDKGYITR